MQSFDTHFVASLDKLLDKLVDMPMIWDVHGISLLWFKYSSIDCETQYLTTERGTCEVHIPGSYFYSGGSRKLILR